MLSGPEQRKSREKAKVSAFSTLQSECPIGQMKSSFGQHNLANITAALKVGSLLQIPEDIMFKAVKTRGFCHTDCNHTWHAGRY